VSEDELQASRARLAASAREERRRIERALHDGAQQDLIALSVRLQLLREAVAGDSARALSLVEEAQRETRAALDRIRALAGEIYPPLLEARGLPHALRAAGARIDADGLARYPADVEASVYFCCRALMEHPDNSVSIRLREDAGRLCADLECTEPVDVTAARDLIEARGGTLSVEPAGDGSTRVAVAVPLV